MQRIEYRRLRLILFPAALIAGTVAGGCGSTPPRPQAAAACAVSTGAPGAASPVLAAAALLTADVQVAAHRAAHPRCLPLSPGSIVRLSVGDRTEFVANGPPTLQPAHPDAVAVSTLPGPVEHGPGGPGAMSTPHVIVRLVALAPGTVTVRWTDCSGTGC